MNNDFIKLATIFMVIGFTVAAQAQSNQGSQTFSPYTPEQLEAFNNQRISPTEGPFGSVGPVESNQKPLNLQKKPSIDSRYFNVPEGEQEAESLETESDDPYTPMVPAVSF